MPKYVGRVFLDVDGLVIDFKTFTEKGFTARKPVSTMNRTGFVNVTPRYGCEVEYPIPEDEDEFDFEAVENGTLTVEYENGRRTTYTGVCFVESGDVKYDGENEAVRTITFGAAARVKE